MKLEIIETKKNPLLQREEIMLNVIHTESPTPSKNDIRKKYSAQKTIPIERIEVVFVKSGFGHTSSKAYLKIWNKVQGHLKVEPESQDITSTQEQSQTELGNTQESSTNSKETETKSTQEETSKKQEAAEKKIEEIKEKSREG